MERKINRQALENILQAQDIDSLSYDALTDLFLNEKEIQSYAPDGICHIDPRNGDRIVFNSRRARRPHDNIPPTEQLLPKLSREDCAICNGVTTGVIDVTELSEGFTFLNKNLFPILYPSESSDRNPINHDVTNLDITGRAAHGLHLLQWTSSYHDRDWHNMPKSDRIVVMNRLAVLERKLLTSASDFMPPVNKSSKSADHFGYVSIIKNFGRLVGGSLVHGHQQIGFSNVIPRRVLDHHNFLEKHGYSFADYMLNSNPKELLIKDYGPTVLLVPYFMRRPYDMYLIVKDTSKSYLYQLDELEIGAIADGWHDAIWLMLAAMTSIGKEQAYNVITNNGPGTGIYFEFLPYTQEIGGFEHLGLYLCQGNPYSVSEHIASMMADV